MRGRARTEDSRSRMEGYWLGEKHIMASNELFNQQEDGVSGMYTEALRHGPVKVDAETIVKAEGTIENGAAGETADPAEWMRVTLSSIREGVITTDAHGLVTSINAAAETLTGWASEAACGRELTSVFCVEKTDGAAGVLDAAARHPGERTGIQASEDDDNEHGNENGRGNGNQNGSENAISGGAERRAVLDARGGKRREIEYRSTAVTNAAGNAAGAVVVFTERRRSDSLSGAVVAPVADISPVTVMAPVTAIAPVTGMAPVTVNAVAKAEAELQAERRSELSQQFVVNSLPIKLFTARPDGRLDFYNAQWMEYTGLAIEQITDWGWMQFIDPADVDENVRCWQLALKSGRPFEFEHRFRRADGAYRWHFTRGVPMHDEAGRVVMWVGTSTDVHALKLADAALRESETRYRRLFQTAKDGILILDAQTGKITDANAFMCGMLGTDYAELLGKELYEIGMPEDAQENRAAFAGMQRSGYLRHDHLPVRNRRGERVEVEFVANIYQEGQKLVAQCNVRDIGERNRMKRQIAEQTEELAEQSRRKDEFLAMLSHELRNPLAPIRAAVHLLKFHERGSGNIIQHQAREIIERQVGNLTKLVSDLMEISRVVSGRVRLDLQAVDIRQAIANALQTAGPLIEQHRHGVTLLLCDEPAWVEADPTRLEEVLVNLLNNAAKYTPEGGRIAVECDCSEAGEVESGPGSRLDYGRRQVVVRVRDSGVGIDEDLLPRIFDLFAQADRSLARSAGGLGIGLTLVHRIVEMHGGTITASSEGPGQGSVFTLVLPGIGAPREIEPNSDETDEKLVLADEARNVHREQETGGVRILMVDDNADLVKMMAGVLRLKGHTVRCEHTGPLGLQAAEQWSPEVVLLDIGLPGLDGYEIAKRLRGATEASKGFKAGVGAGAAKRAGSGDRLSDGDSDEEVGNEGGWMNQDRERREGESEDTDNRDAKRLRLIALTGYGREADVNLAREAGFDGHLVKPCDFEELERMIAAKTLRM